MPELANRIDGVSIGGVTSRILEMSLLFICPTLLALNMHLRART